MLISICYLVVKGLLQTQSNGHTKLMDFLDEQRMCRLYEKDVYKRQLRGWIRNDKGIPAHKIGKQWKFKCSELDVWVKSGKSAIE